MTFVSSLEPQSVWKHFDQILTIPRGSKNEEAIRRYVVSVAERCGLKHRVDAAGNVVVVKPASPDKEKAAPLVLQSHLDMVNEKNSDVTHDFTKDPIVPRRDGEYLKASGTTLGSDNGIGVASMLAVMESTDLVHPPIEFLFTIDEETGLTGASDLDAKDLTGRRLLNLDTEEEGALYVGCAGGAGSSLTLPLTKAPAGQAEVALALAMAGLRGGHSGVDIHLQRGNAIKLLARVLWGAAATPYRIASFSGGNMHNAIPREARATAVLSPGAVAAFRAACEREAAAIAAEFRAVDPDLKFSIAEAKAPAEVWDESTTRSAVALLNALPHGVLMMSNDIAGLVETSTNLATVAEKDGGLAIHMSNRSSVASALVAARARMRAIAELAGAAVKEEGGYPGWKPNMSSPLLALVRKVHNDVLGKEPEIKAIHAGLECGIIGEKLPGMDMLSLGPQIEFPHSPDERVRIDSVTGFWKLLTASLAKLAA